METSGEDRVRLQLVSREHEREFVELWQRCLAGYPVDSNAEQAFNSLQAELGECYLDSCYQIVARGQAIGVVLPHIEPGTEAEGRIFFLGLVPEARGKGFGQSAHKQALNLLKKAFRAETCIGVTDIDNQAMQRIFDQNGMTARGRLQVYSKKLV
nr:GNAT family N-acetyltransferase [Thalassobacillus sp. CUG 92003]